MEWIKPIVDRTIRDITDKTQKGFLKYDDLYRIEGNLLFIADILGVARTIKDWSARPIPYKKDFNRILGNLDLVKEAWPVPNIPITPVHPLNHFEKINEIERIELLIKSHIDATNNSWNRCGEVFAGEIGVI